MGSKQKGLDPKILPQYMEPLSKGLSCTITNQVYHASLPKTTCNLRPIEQNQLNQSTNSHFPTKLKPTGKLKKKIQQASEKIRPINFNPCVDKHKNPLAAGVSKGHSFPCTGCVLCLQLCTL